MPEPVSPRLNLFLKKPLDQLTTGLRLFLYIFSFVRVHPIHLRLIKDLKALELGWTLINADISQHSLNQTRKRQFHADINLIKFG